MYFTKKDRIKQFENLMGTYAPEELKNSLIERGFFNMPASTHYHGAYEGGLFDHSFYVTKALLSLTKRLELKWQKERSPYLVGMFHDLCKVDAYTRNNGKWEYNKEMLLTGHGDKSAILLMQYIDLTIEEILCIRWHMGAFDKTDNWDSYGLSIEKYPNVLYTHTADMIAARIVESQEETHGEK